MSKACGLIGFILFLGLSQTTLGKPTLLTLKGSKARSVQIVSASQFSHYKSYRQWKNEKIQEALSKLNATRIRLDNRKIAQTQSNSKTEASSGPDLKLNQLEAQMRLDLMSIELAKDLTVTDYFVGYVNKIQEKKEFINEISSKMSAEEVAELMTAYAESIFGRPPVDTPKTALKDTSKEATK